MINKQLQQRFERTYIQYYAKTKRFAYQYVQSNEDAENIVQDIFTELWERLDTLPTDINLVAYLFTSVKNRSLDTLRRRFLTQEIERQLQEEYTLNLKLKIDSLEALDTKLFDQENTEAILTQAINNLPERCKEIFIKSKLEGKRQKEIANELSITVNTVETQMGIAFKKLRKDLQHYMPLYIFLTYL